MAFAGVATRNENAISAAREGPQYEGRIEASGAHQADEAHIRRILHPGSACQIRRAVRTPVAGEANDDGFEVFAHWVISLRGNQLEISQQQPIDLGNDLVVAEARTAD